MSLGKKDIPQVPVISPGMNISSLGAGSYMPFPYSSNFMPFGMYSPVAWIQNLNYSLMALSQMVEVLAISATGLGATVVQTIKLIRSSLRFCYDTKWAKWLQEKSKKSKVFRWIVIFLSIIVAHNCINLVKWYYTKKIKPLNIPTLLDSPSLPTSSDEVVQNWLSSFKSSSTV